MAHLASSSTGLSSGRQCAWRRFTLNWNRKELGNIDGQRGGDTIEQIDRHVEIAAFDSADGRAVNTGIYGKVFLRHLFVGTHLPKIPSKSLTSIHGRMATILKARNPSDISDIFQFGRELSPPGDKL
ncbi:hypothetical protein [Rhizobium leguminosarum]|uniref:hypothetical protein n=1 Tax=Rhizobium leguminosarum TaxID=384 RepID=UPI003D7A3808